MVVLEYLSASLLGGDKAFELVERVELDCDHMLRAILRLHALGQISCLGQAVTQLFQILRVALDSDAEAWLNLRGEANTCRHPRRGSLGCDARQLVGKVDKRKSASQQLNDARYVLLS